jgi:hypothetical protein
LAALQCHPRRVTIIRRLLLLSLVAAAGGCVHAPVPPSERGLWVGALHLCRDNVVSARRSVERWGGPAVTLSVTPAMRGPLAKETAAWVDKPMPVRIDGRTVAAPTVEEAITRGELRMLVPDRAINRAIEKAARAPCA